MIEKTLKTFDGSLRVRIPTILNEITLGQMIGMQEKHYLNDLDAISILSGVSKDELNNVINFDEFNFFGEGTSGAGATSYTYACASSFYAFSARSTCVISP